jgi:hypothetical protein
MKVNRVDRGANADAHILLAKSHKPGHEERISALEGKDKKKDGDAPKKDDDGKPVKVKGEVAERIRRFLTEGGDAAAGETPEVEDKPKSDFQPTPVNPREKGSRVGEDGSGSRIVRIDPAMFEVVSATGNMMEWAIAPEELPDGVEEAMMTMVQSGETVMFQWMIDPLAGPPVEGNAKTAAEAFVAMRGALTNTAAIDPTEPLGGLSGEAPPLKPGGAAAPSVNGPAPAKPKPKPGQQALTKRSDMVGHFTRNKKRKKKDEEKSSHNLEKAGTSNTGYTINFSDGSTTVTGTARTPEDRVTSALDIITKGLVETDVLSESATGEDIRDILPTNLLAKLHNELSA